VVVVDFVFIKFLPVDGTPSIDDISQDEWDNETDVEHRTERELAAA
jgi:hypothetical protein